MSNVPNRPKGKSLKNLRMVWSFALAYPGRIAIAGLALAVAAGATSGSAALLAIPRWLEPIATATRFYFVSWLGERTVADIRLAVHRNLLRLSPGFFEENRPAEITSRITVDTTIIEQVVGTTLSVALRNLVMGLACTAMLGSRSGGSST